VEMSKPISQGRRIGFDFGEKRIGVAASDAASILVSPYATLLNDHQLPQKLKGLFAEIEPIYVVIGNPIHLSGTESSKSALAMEFGIMMKSYFSGPIYLVDERMSTQNAYSQMREIGKNERQSKSVIDQIAAVTILESAMHNERSGSAVGIAI
jgi:putative Holliday junction resolvase